LQPATSIASPILIGRLVEQLGAGQKIATVSASAAKRTRASQNRRARACCFFPESGFPTGRKNRLKNRFDRAVSNGGYL